MEIVDGARAWSRAPAAEFVAAFDDGGPLHPLLLWVRTQGSRADLHLWSDPKAQMHRARIVSGTVGLADIDWSPVRFQITARRPFNRLAASTLDSGWHRHAAAAVPVLRARDFLSHALEETAARARFGVDALDGCPMITQEYAPVLPGALTDSPPVRAVQEALLPSPIPGGAPFFSAAPDAVVAKDGAYELLRMYRARAPELRHACAQAHVDLQLFAIAGADRIVDARHRLGLRTGRAPAPDAAAHAHVVVESGVSERLVAQYDAVRERLVERGVLDAGRVRFTVVSPGTSPGRSLVAEGVDGRPSRG